MTDIPYVQALRDRHGHPRYYFRRPGFKRVTLPGAPGSLEFMAAYQTALGGEMPAEHPPVGEKLSPPGSVGRAIARYYQHNSFTHELAEATQKSRRNILENFRRDFGHVSLKALTRVRIEELLGAKVPNMQRNWLKTLRGLMKFALAFDLIEIDPTVDIRRAKVAKTDGWYTWTEADIAKFEARWPVGSTPRLAMTLMLYTSGRRSDAVALGPQHVKDGRIAIKPKKTERTTGQRLSIPILPPLADALAAIPAQAGAVEHLTFLVTAYGKPYSAAGFGNRVREWCDAAELPECTSHGLRKACCVRLAEAGCSEYEIQAITGHSALDEIRTYVRAARQANLADDAFAKMQARQARVTEGGIGHNRGPALAE